MKISRYFALVTTPIAALSIFSIYRRVFNVELNGWMSALSDRSQHLIHNLVDSPSRHLLGWEPPQFLSDLWVLSLWWTGVMASATVGAMKDKGAPTPLSSHLMMIPIRIFLGYSLIGFFWAAIVIPASFARFRTGDTDLDRYGHWIRTLTITCILFVAGFFVLNHLA